MALGIQSIRTGSVMPHDFSVVPKAEIQRSAFRRSHSHKTVFNEGYLIPIYVDEALPGDTFKLNVSAVCRMATPVVPFMDNVYLDFFFFSVPNRLLWDNWQKFMGEKIKPGDSNDYLLPRFELGTAFDVGTLPDYMGLPIKVTTTKFSALPLRAYNLIYNEWFRDENLIDSVPVDTDDGPTTSLNNYVLRKRGKRHDYFTSCLPWPQKGTQVNLPLGSRAPVIGTNVALGLTDTAANFAMHNTNGISEPRLETAGFGLAAGTAAGANITTAAGKTLGVTTDGTKSGLTADLTNAIAATINDLRQVFQLQRLMERDARGGTRYTEILRSHFGVLSPDSRIQRPEYLGGGSKRINVDPVPYTGDNSGATKTAGYLGAAAYANVSGIGFTKSFVEHCTLIGIANIRADLTYQSGQNRMWNRRTKYDFYWPALAHLGEQAVLNRELHTVGTVADDTVFGYQERWSEYRYKPSLITGQLRSQATTPLHWWHLAQQFTGAAPLLNQTFIEENPPITRVIATTAYPRFVFDGFFDIVCTRPMPTYSVPGLIDHF